MGYINAINIEDGGHYLIEPTLYSTASGTNTYTASFPTGFELTEKICVQVKFTNNNTAAATLNNIPIFFNGTAVTAGTIKANHIYPLVYDGTNWNIVSDINTWRPINNTLTSDSTDTSLSAALGKALKGLIDNKANSDHNHDDDYAAISHSHGNITNDGKIGSTANLAVYTTTGGKLTAGTLKTDAPTASGTALSFITSVSQDSKGKITASKATVATFVQSGSNAAAGLVPKPSTTAGTTQFLREDGSWATPNYTVNTDQNVKLNSNTENKEFSILLKTTNNATSETGEVNFGATTNKLVTINPSTGRITAPGGLAGKADTAGTADSANAVALSNISGADDLKAIEALSGTSGFLKKTAANTWTLDTSTYLTSHGPSYGKITVSAQSSETTALTSLSSATTPTAKNANETLKFTTANKWIVATGTNSSTAGSDEIKIAHLVPNSITNSGPNSAQTPGYNSTFNIPVISVDEAGHVTGISSTTVKIPASDNSDTKVNVTAAGATITKNYILMTSTQPTSTATGHTAIGSALMWVNAADKGKFELVLGNNTATTTSGGQYGQLALYSASTAGTYLKAADGTTWTTATLLAKTGTIALTSDIPTNLNQLTNGPGYVTSSGVTSITLKAGAGISLDTDNTAITSTGTRTISIKDMNTSSGSTTKWLNLKGGWSTPTAADIGAAASGHNHDTSYLKLDGSNNMTGTLNIKPNSGEGGEIHLHAVANTEAGIVLDHYGNSFRVFGIASADGTTKTGTGTPLVIDPYEKTITGGYTLTGTLNGNASTATAWANARKVYVALGTASKTTTINGGASNAAAIALGIDGTLGIEHGGTNATTALSAIKNLFTDSTVTVASGDFTDSTIMITSNNSGSTDNWYQRTGLKIWNYIKSKADSVYAGINALSVANALVYKGVLAGAATTDSNTYGALTPAANCGDTYKVSTAGFINGLRVEVGDMLICTTDETPAAASSGDNIYTTIRNNWNIILTSEGSVSTSSTSSTDNAIARWNGTSGRIILDSGVTIDDSNNITIPSSIYFGSITNATSRGILIYSSSSNKYGIWYHNNTIDKMMFSASGNADSITGADFCINAHGDGTLATRNQRIPHTGNNTGSVGGENSPVYVDGGQIKACTTYANAIVGKANAANLTTTENAIAKYSDETGTFADSGVTIDDNNNINTPGNLTLYRTASGASPSLIFNRKNGNETDWRIYVTSGKLIFSSATNASTWTDRAYFSDNSGVFNLTDALNSIRTTTGNWITVTGKNSVNHGEWNLQTLGTTSVEGWSTLYIGNDKKSNVADNASGRIYLYNKNGAAVALEGGYGQLDGTNSINYISTSYISATLIFGDLVGNASTASAVAWSGVTGAPENVTRTTDGFMSKEDKIKLDDMEVIIGTLTASTNKWTGTASKITALYDGLTIKYYLPWAGTSTAATLKLKLADGTETAEIGCYYSNNTRLTTHYAKGSVITLTYFSAGSIKIDGTATTLNRWIADANYDSDNDYRTRQTVDDTTNANRALILAYCSIADANENTARVVYRSSKFYANPSTGDLYATTFNGALTGNADTATTLKDTHKIWGHDFNGSADVTGDLDWDNGTYRQRIQITDDSTADTAVFTFLQSENSGTNYSDLFTIKDNGNIVIGKRITTTTPTSAVETTRILIVPYYHTGGPWYIASKDDKTYAYLTIKYGSNELIETRSDGRISITKNISSTSTSTGSLVVAGGVGIAGALHTSILSIDSTEMVSHILFARQNWNYITYPNHDNAALAIGFGTGDNTNLQLVILKGGTVRPGGNNSQNLGDSSHTWANVYATTFSGTASNVTTTADTTNTMYLVGVKSGATTTLLHDTSITAKADVLTVGKLTITGGTTNSSMASSGTLTISNGTKALTLSTTTAALTISTTTGAITMQTNGASGGNLTIKTANAGAISILSAKSSINLDAATTMSLSSTTSTSIAATTTMSITSTTSTSISATTTMSISGTQGTSINSGSNYTIAFKINNVEKGQFNKNGMFQLNDTGTQDKYKLYVNGDSAFNGKIAIGELIDNIISETVHMEWNETDKSLDFVFA